MYSDISVLLHFISSHLDSFISIANSKELFLWGGTIVILLVIVVFFAIMTIKKLVTNLAIGYMVIFLGEYFFHIDLVPNWMLWGLMAFFGPLVPILNFIYQLVM